MGDSFVSEGIRWINFTDFMSKILVGSTLIPASLAMTLGFWPTMSGLIRPSAMTGRNFQFFGFNR